MRLSLQEQETIINYCPADAYGSVFTSKPNVWKRLEKIRGFDLVRVEEQDGKIYGKEFKFRKDYFRLSSKGFIVGPKRGQK